MKKLMMALLLGLLLLGKSGCAGEKVFVEGKSYSAHKLSQRPGTSY